MNLSSHKKVHKILLQLRNFWALLQKCSRLFRKYFCCICWLEFHQSGIVALCGLSLQLFSCFFFSKHIVFMSHLQGWNSNCLPLQWEFWVCWNENLQKKLVPSLHLHFISLEPEVIFVFAAGVTQVEHSLLTNYLMVYIQAPYRGKNHTFLLKKAQFLCDFWFSQNKVFSNVHKNFQSSHYFFI